MPEYPHIQRYHDDLRRLIEFGGSDSEGSIRRAFENCLDAYCRENKEPLTLVAELTTPRGVQPDGTVKDSLRMARGYWEAKDTHDDLEVEVQRKFDRGYPRDNIIFEDSETAILYQDGELATRADMRRPGELHRLIRLFLEYELPQIDEFRRAQQQFINDLPTVLANLRGAIDDAERGNAAYQVAASDFLGLCRATISPDVTVDDVREMLLQHILTKDIFLRIFAEDQFHRENNVAQRLTALEETFFTGNVKRDAIARLRSYYGAISRAADEIVDYAEKQTFLKVIYQDFYKTYNPKAADRLGVVYTPNDIVDFIVRSTDRLLSDHFSRRLGDDDVQILDPATGTGTFVTSLINHLPSERVAQKYRKEIHANEIAILPYYIANLNIEYTYKERTGRYEAFPALCFVDTLDNIDWQGDSGGSVQRQAGMNLGGLSTENWVRIQEQNEATISVIIGNPPYNDSQADWNDFNPNREYPEIDRRIRETYVARSTATKTHQYDMYKRFLRWASDRLADNGIIAFITNRSYLDSTQDDGFRATMLDEFDDLYIIDLGGSIQEERPTTNVFGITIGVAIGFFVRSGSRETGKLYYHKFTDDRQQIDGRMTLKDIQIEDVVFDEITPDGRGNWLAQSTTDFQTLIPTAHTKAQQRADFESGQCVFELVAPGVKTNRDEWVYAFRRKDLDDKIAFFSTTYNNLLDANRDPTVPIIKWSRDLRDQYRRGRRISIRRESHIRSLYRPFVAKHHFADLVMNDVLTSNHYTMYGRTLTTANPTICIKGPSANVFSVLASDRLANEKFCGTNNGGTFLLPLYRHDDDGQPVSNVTEWSVAQFRDHYDDQAISAEEIFAYVYAVLHDPVYRETYEAELRQEFPRLPFYDDFREWARIGQALLDLHIGFEDADPWPLERVEGEGKPGKPKLSVNKLRGIITLDGRTSLAGVPAEAWDYVLGTRSALEWVLDQHKEKKPRDATIRDKFDTYKFADHKERVIELLRRVCTVSVRTMELIDELPNGS